MDHFLVRCALSRRSEISPDPGEKSVFVPAANEARSLRCAGMKTRANDDASRGMTDCRGPFAPPPLPFDGEALHLTPPFLKRKLATQSHQTLKHSKLRLGPFKFCLFPLDFEINTGETQEVTEMRRNEKDFYSCCPQASYCRRAVPIP